ncbi:MAG: hypothetical protein AAF598_04915 [Bacteroidota bacterium]
MIRIIFVILVALIAFYVVGLSVKMINSKRCQACEGQGYWKGTRGDINQCTQCAGTGRMH